MIWLSGVMVFPVTALAWKRTAEGKWREEEGVSEALAWLSSRSTAHDVEALVEHARHVVASL